MEAPVRHPTTHPNAGQSARSAVPGSMITPNPIPPPVNPDLVEAGRHLFAQDCQFLRAIADLSQLPPAGLPELAFVGRSNVGKSSLVNALTGRRTLARTSNTPGRTQQLIFFALGDRLHLVDLPGYGFAKVPKPMVEAWTRLLRAYLRGRPTLRLALVLVDSRHGVKDNDRETMRLLDQAAVPYRVVLTKADKIKPGAARPLLAATEAILKGHPAAFPTALLTSAETKAGVPELKAEIVRAVLSD